jgi:hypothetical protein
MEFNWTEQEEQAFADIMAAGRLERLPAIRLFRRCKDNLTRALVIATAEAPSDAQIARRKIVGDRMRARHAQKRSKTAPTVPILITETARPAI